MGKLEYIIRITDCPGGQSPYVWSVLSGSLPDGLLLSPSGTIAGVPTAAGGPVYFSVKVIDNMSVPATQDVSITVTGAPSITSSAELAAGEIGISYYSNSLTAKDGTSPLVWSASGLPPGLTIASNGIIAEPRPPPVTTA